MLPLVFLLSRFCCLFLPAATFLLFLSSFTAISWRLSLVRPAGLNSTRVLLQHPLAPTCVVNSDDPGAPARFTFLALVEGRGEKNRRCKLRPRIHRFSARLLSRQHRRGRVRSSHLACFICIQLARLVYYAGFIGMRESAVRFILLKRGGERLRDIRERVYTAS